MKIRPVSELAGVAAPAWPDLFAATASSPVRVDVLRPDRASAARTLYALQVTCGSVLGALAYNCGGILIDHGWVRVLGGGGVQLPSLATANTLDNHPRSRQSPPVLVTAYDVLGGRFAIDGGGLGAGDGEVFYWAPDTLRWEGLGLGHAAFVSAFLQGAVTDFYADWRWPGWEAEVAAVRTDQGLSLFPPPFALEGTNLARVSRRPIPFVELSAFYDDVAAQTSNLGPGESFRFTVSD